MTSFQYEAINERGIPSKGTLDARDVGEVRERLKRKGLHLISVHQDLGKQRKRLNIPQPDSGKTFTLGGGVSLRDLSHFTKQMSTLLNAGVPVVRSIDIMLEMLRPGNLRNAMIDIKAEVESGAPLSEAMSRNPKVFDELFVNMVKAGEAGGFLGAILRRLSEFMTKSHRLHKKVIGALIYPASVLTIAFGVLSLIMIFVIPKIIKIINDMGAPTPYITQVLIDISSLFVSHWYLLFMGPSIAAGAISFIRSTRQGRFAFDMLLLYLPIFGQLIRKSCVSRFCRTFSELSNAGVPILESLTILQKAAGNEVVALAVSDIQASIREGETIADPMRKSGVFDPMVVNMVAVGEETGELDNMMESIANDYEEDVDSMVASLSSLIEPLMIVGMGLIIGFICVALFLPIFSGVIEGVSAP
ncbi:MAG: type II secretion system F family protein [Planctomycetes bacterium]|nr:type II secretion system F family protein [Planctomycetota bacterium]